MPPVFFTPAYPKPIYPARVNCWNCGRFVYGSVIMPHRRCDRCGVTWLIVLPPVDPRMPVDRAGEMRQLRSKYPFDLNHPRADDFDDFIDHTRVNYPSPA